MAQRQLLHNKLKEILGSDNVYFQPPANYQMSYPCIVYERDDQKTEFADNEPYNILKKYSVTVIDRDPDSAIPYQVAVLPTCTFRRFFAVDSLNHDVFTLFF